MLGFLQAVGLGRLLAYRCSYLASMHVYCVSVSAETVQLTDVSVCPMFVGIMDIT